MEIQWESSEILESKVGENPEQWEVKGNWKVETNESFNSEASSAAFVSPQNHTVAPPCPPTAARPLPLLLPLLAPPSLLHPSPSLSLLCFRFLVTPFSPVTSCWTNILSREFCRSVFTLICLHVVLK